jgi:hypothetical protein
MRGQQGKLKEIVAMKQNSTSVYWLMMHTDLVGKTGAGAGEEQGVQMIDVYFQLCKING